MKEPDGCTILPRKGVSTSAAEKKTTRGVLVTVTVHVCRSMRVPNTEINLFTKQTIYLYTPISVIF
jgi:hypothetical protein